jgi:hypothetical protein
MHVEVVGVVGDSGFDLVEEFAELAGAMAGVAFTDDGAGGDVERGEQRGGAMALVVVAPARRLAGLDIATGAVIGKCYARSGSSTGRRPRTASRTPFPSPRSQPN